MIFAPVFTTKQIVLSPFDVVSNFEYKDPDRKEALRYLYDTIELIAKNDGYKLLFSTVKNQPLINKMVEFGWSEAGKTTEMIKPIL